MIEPVEGANAAEIGRYLARRPYDNVFLQWLVQCGAMTHHGRPICFLSRDSDAAIDGVAYFGAQFVLAAHSDEALRGFNEIARTMHPARMIVGPREQMLRWWEHLERWHPKPRAIRSHQPVYAVSRAALRGSRADAEVGRATAAELDEIARESAAMIEHETGIDPSINNRDFRERTAHGIRAGCWWRWRVQGTLRFQCSVGARAATTAQLQGVWTPPEQRAKGHATRALGAICDHLLDEVPTLSLYVNDFNAGAVALYERLGFEPVGEFMTLLF